MEQKHGIKGILFNFSGTLDTEGREWFDLIWQEYRDIHIPVSKSDYLCAHGYAEEQIVEKRLIKPGFNLYQMLHTKLSLQIKYLIDNGLLSDNGCTQKYPQQLAVLCYNIAIMYVRKNEKTDSQRWSPLPPSHRSTSLHRRRKTRRFQQRQIQCKILPGRALRCAIQNKQRGNHPAL